MRRLLTEAKRWENILYNYFRENHPDLVDSWNQPIRNLLTQEQINTMEAQHQNIDTPLIVYYKAKFCSLFDINRGKGPIKYVPGLARISFNELGLNMTRLVTENNCPQEIGTLKNLVRFIECTPGLNEKFDEDLNGLSYFDLYDKINPMRKNSNRLNQERLSSLKLQNKNYRVIPINSQKEASRYSEYTSWCITTMMDQWENYTRFGRRFYFLLKNGFENVPLPADPEAVGAPFDAYGLSMISVLVDMEGEPVHVTTRYNHEFNGEDNPDLHTAEQVQNITGINFYQELKPYTREELHSMGIISFDEVPELLASGKDIDEIFDEVINCYEISDEVNGYGEFYRVHLNGKYNFLHKKHNTLVLLCRRWYNMMYRFSEGLAKVKLNNKCGFIDKTGREVIPCKYDWVNLFLKGLAKVKLNRKYGYIDRTGREVIPCKYDGINAFSEGLAKVELNDKLGIIDKSGREVIPCKYDWINDFSEGLAKVELNNKFGYIDRTGREVIPCKYDSIYDFKDGLSKVSLNDKLGIIDKSGKEVIPCKYDSIYDFKDGLSKVSLNGKWGFIDKTGKEICPCKYDGIGDFVEGLAPVILNWKLGFIDKTGREVIPLKYDYAGNFEEGLARVQLNGKYSYIDKTGREVIPCKYDWVDDFSEGLAVVKLNEKYGCIDTTGREVIPCKYDYIMDLKDGFVKVKLNGKWDYINKRGNWEDEKTSVLPESITKITISDIRYMVNECVNRLNEMGYNPREYLPRVRGGWTQPKITKQLKKNGSLSGPLESIRLIAEFDNVDELRSHIFWHGSKYIQTSLKPSIVLPRYQVERDGGGGYGRQYWGISLTSDKFTATNFGGTGSRGTWVHPVVLAKDAVVKTMPKLTDADDVEDIIEELWNEGIDAVYIGGGGESELLVLNPKCIANMEASQYYEYYRLYRSNVSNPSDEQLQELLDKCKMIVNGGGSFENGEQELETKRLMRKI